MLLRSNDFVFHGFALILAAAMIGAPMLLSERSQISLASDIRESGIDVQGDRLGSMAIGQGLTHTLLRDTEGRLFARITADVQRGSPSIVPSAGVFDALLDHELRALSGYDLTVSYQLRPSPENGARQVDLGFFEDGLGQSYWVETPIESGMGVYSIDVDVPYCDPTFGFAGVWPSHEYAANTVDLYAITIEIRGEADCTDRPS